MKPRALIIDTNVVVAGLLTANGDSSVAIILDAMLDGAFPFLLSPDLLGEYRNILLRRRVTDLHGLTRDEVDDLLTDLTANAIWREPPSHWPAPDPGDNHLWALLDHHPHSVLVTGDRLLLDSPPRDDSVIAPELCVQRFLRR